MWWDTSTHTTLFRHPYDVVLTLWTLYRRWNDVLCLRGYYQLFEDFFILFFYFIFFFLRINKASSLFFKHLKTFKNLPHNVDETKKAKIMNTFVITISQLLISVFLIKLLIFLNFFYIYIYIATFLMWQQGFSNK